ncbi:MAG: hypothetical protein Q9166_007281 [cf. Caloplaca sp. 2 TL-2023]
MPNYSIHNGIYDQPYSRSPAPFDYSAFNPNRNPAHSAPPYDHSFTYGHPSLPNHDQYGFPRSFQQNQHQTQDQTISPQALQNYPAGYQQNNVQKMQLNQAAIDPALASRKPSNYAVPPPEPITRQGWRSLSAAMPISKVQGNFVVKSNSEFPVKTNSKHLAGFTFVGRDNVEVATTKATVPKYNHRRSRNEIRQLLYKEKGTGPWPVSREPLLKKLKMSAKTSISRPSTGSRGTSITSSPSSTESESESEQDAADSDYETGSEQEDEPEEPSPLPPIRPADPMKAIEYDIVKAVWAKRRVILSGVVIRTALGEFWTAIKGLRDKWKGEVTILQQAIEKKEKAKMIEYDRRAANYRKLLESCIRLTLKHGHPDIVEKIGENPSFSAVLYSFILDRAKEADYAGSLLMSHCVTIDQPMLERTKMDKVLPKIVKRGDEQGKAFAQKVLDNAAAVSKQKSSDSKAPKSSENKETTTKSTVTSLKTFTDTSSGIKKSQPGEAAGSQAAKKSSAASTSASPNSISAGAKSNNLATKKPSGTDSKALNKGAVSATTTAKVKTSVVAPKATSFFSGLQSASKKPGTSLKAAKSKDAKDGSGQDIKNTAANPKPIFSFADTFANLHKAKESAPTKSEENRTPETAEERKKRLRKEDRRRLRVSFKPEDSLVQVRIFEHHPDEEIGHNDSMVRDANDIKGEGQMLKMHRERDVMDEDEDGGDGGEGVAVEENLRAWTSPSFVDFSEIPPEEHERNFSARGGKKQALSEEKAVQEQREMTTLMVIYTSKSDIPPSPREPVEQDPEDFNPEQSFGAPTDETKARESRYYAAQNGQQSATAPTPDISHLLKLLNPQQNQAPQPQMQQQSTQPTSNGLEAIFAQFSNFQQQPAQMHPQPMTQQPPASGFDYNAAMATINQLNQPSTTYNQAPQQAPNVDLSSILAQFQQQPQPAAPIQGYGYGNTYQNENDRKRPLDQDGQQNGDYGYSKGKRVKSGTDVCCHAIWLGGPSKGQDETEWAIEPFQRGETPTFIEHIKAGLKLLEEEPDSFLVSSGGPTKRDRTELTESESYLELAQANDLFDLCPADALARVTLESFSTDSYQNLLFSIIVFRQLQGTYPSHVTLISHAFKRPRFIDLHLSAIRWPANRFTYVGIDPPESVTSKKDLEEGERMRGYGLWKGDLYGVGAGLAGKRVARGWKERLMVKNLLWDLEGMEREQVQGLLEWRGGTDGTEIYPEKLPWDETTV